MLACHARVRSSTLRGSANADVAQLVERLPEEQSVGGSSPSVSTIILAGHTATHPSMNEYCRSGPVGNPVKRYGF